MSSFVNFDPPTLLEEVAQNIRTIVSTASASVPLDRGFGVDTMGLDDPIPSVKSFVTRDVIDAVGKYEPRADIVDIDYIGNNLTGRVDIKILFKLKEGNDIYNVNV